jgi:hypothetical protein
MIFAGISYCCLSSKHVTLRIGRATIALWLSFEKTRAATASLHPPRSCRYIPLVAPAWSPGMGPSHSASPRVILHTMRDYLYPPRGTPGIITYAKTARCKRSPARQGADLLHSAFRNDGLPGQGSSSHGAETREGATGACSSLPIFERDLREQCGGAYRCD